MIKKIITIYPIDNGGVKFGGIESFIKDLIRYAPENLELQIVGITTDVNKISVGKWHSIIFEGRKINFLSVLKVKNPNKRSIIPLTLKFTFALLFHRHKIDFKNNILIFHRIEPSCVFINRNIKKILFVHSETEFIKNKQNESRWKKLSILYFILESLCIKQMKKIFVIGESIRKYYQGIYSELSDRIKFVYTWYNSDVFYRNSKIVANALLKELNIPYRKPIILFVGRLELIKDPFLAVNSYILVNKVFSNSQLIIVGDGSLRKKLVQYVKKINFSNNIFLIGQKTPELIARLMNISDILLLTSASEGGPSKVVLEALACGIPVVATNVGLIGNVVKQNISGEVVKSRNPEDIAEAVIRVLKNPPPPSLCHKIVQEYSHNKVINRIFCEIGNT